MPLRPSAARAALCILAALAVLAPDAGARDFVLFESGPVRPLALAPSGARLFVANAPDDRLEIFNIDAAGALSYGGGVQVGLEPVAVAARTSTEVWVVNHLSDSVSIVDVGVSPPRVVRTLLVGDEPRDIVFAAGGTRAFVTTAHRGQRRTDPAIASAFDDNNGDPQLTTPSVPRADVWVFDTADPGAIFGGLPLKVVELFGDTPRALAVSPDGNTVYAAVFQSGNQTTTVNEGVVCDGFATAAACAGDGITSPNGLASGNLPGGNPGPSANHQLVAAPEVGLIVKFDPASGEWQDEVGRNWSNGVRFFLPDHDVFAIDANTLVQTSQYDHVGTILFNMAVNPVSGKVYVSNADSQNLTRFEGGGVFGGSTVQGNLAHYDVSVLSGASSVAARHLNKHINYATTPAPAGTKQHSLATPLDMVVSSDGSTLYVAAFGSSKVGVFQTATLEDDSFDPTVQSAQYIPVSGGGPAGLALVEAKSRLYVYNRFSNTVSIVDTAAGSEIGSVPLHDPEPAPIVKGRPMLYDAQKTSSNGEASCSSCHVFGDFDSLAWDLGDPDADVTSDPMDFTPVPVAGGVNGGAGSGNFHPMKGAMTTQTLRGLANSGGMHWRGDRTNGFFGLDSPYVTNGGADAGDEALNFANFIVAFSGLVGGGTPPTDPQLQTDTLDFTAFALEIALPPNPVRPLDNSLSSLAASGQTFFNNRNVDTQTCITCHDLEPQNGFFGTGGLESFEGETQTVKVPHLRNLYQKVGMFGMPGSSFFLAGDNAHKGDQVRGFGFLHDGSTDTLFRFFRATVFNLAPGFIGFSAGATGDNERLQVQQFMLEFPSDLAPIVGQQATDRGVTDAALASRISLMKTRCGTAFVSKFMGGTVTECDLTVKGVVGNLARGYLYDPVSGTYDSDRAAESGLSQATLDAIADVSGQELTYTATPPGSGVRMALDRDLDGTFDRDELDAGTDPGNPGSVPGACSDGLDNDGDGLVDLADPGCAISGQSIENPQCNDGLDNDGDGAIDLADAQCSGPADHVEAPNPKSCGLGAEVALALVPLLALRARRRRRS
jgi:YVTN family beta-propeller protein